MPALEGPPRDSVKAQDKYPLLCKIPVNFSVTRSFHSHRENIFFIMLFKKHLPNGLGKELLEWKSAIGGSHYIQRFAWGV